MTFGPELAKALVAAQAEFSAVAKTSTNPHFKSKFAPLHEVVRTTSPVLAKHGLAVAQLIGESDGRDTLTTILTHTSGETLESTMLLHLTKNDPQGQGSAITYARRYSYMAMLGLVADEDDDANRAVQSKPKPSPHVETLKAALTNAYPNPAERKEFVEAHIGRSVNGLTDLSEAEIDVVLTELGKEYE
jgi:hypothetical protein